MQNASCRKGEHEVGQMQNMKGGSHASMRVCHTIIIKIAASYSVFGRQTGRVKPKFSETVQPPLMLIR
jgi:hypothetical protein